MEHIDALPRQRAHSAALGWLRRKMGEADLGAIKQLHDLPAELMKGLMAKQGRIIDLFREWDTNGDGRVDREEMLAALTTEGVLDGWMDG